MPQRTAADAPTLDWEDVRCFAALARHGSFPAAARSLRMKADLAEARLANLESTLGMRLFDRDGSRLTLNAAGAAALAEAAQMEMAACSLEQLRFRQLSGGARDDCTAGCDPRRRR